MKKDKKLSSSMENYMRAIYHIVEEKKAARVKDISAFLGIGASSVSEALRNLADKDLINYEPYGIITLTDSGQIIAKDLINRHSVICDFLKNVLSVAEDEVESNANSIESGVTDDVLTKFVRFLEFMKTCSCKNPKWIHSYKYYSEKGEVKEKCHRCIALTKDNPDAVSNENCCGMSSKPCS